MATLNINDPKYFDPFLKTLRDNTSLNYHTENSYLIVYNFYYYQVNYSYPSSTLFDL